MKKAIILHLLLLPIILSDSIKAQEYFQFPTDTGKWSVYSWTNPWGGGYNDATFQYFINGDTLLDSLTYSKIYSIIAQYDTIDTLNAVYLGGLREDIYKHIYYKPGEIYQELSLHCYLENSTLDEFLLYRFDVEVGESFYMCNDFYAPYTLNEIDSVLVDNSYRRRFHVEHYGIISSWIEGIGSEWSLFGPLVEQFEGGDILLCFEEPDVFYYGEQNYFDRCTHFIVGCKELSSQEIYFYPNPASRTISVTYNDNITINEIIIYDQLGEKVFQSNNVTNNIDISTLGQGIYIIELKSNEWKIREKLIIKK